MPKLSLAKLERHLYGAADRLRQEGLDAATYKDYIFGLLFLKRCSDQFEAEYERLVGRKVEQGLVKDEAERRYGENPDYYDTFFVPEQARWTYLSAKLNDATQPFGSRLDKALAALSESNETLEHAPDHRLLFLQRPLQQFQQRQCTLAEADEGAAAAICSLLGLRQVLRTLAGAIAPVFLNRRLDPGYGIGQLLDGDDALVRGFLAHQLHHALGDVAEHDDVTGSRGLKSNDHSFNSFSQSRICCAGFCQSFSSIIPWPMAGNMFASTP